jgi:hypothetical protein
MRFNHKQTNENKYGRYLMATEIGVLINPGDGV